MTPSSPQVDDWNAVKDLVRALVERQYSSRHHRRDGRQPT